MANTKNGRIKSLDKTIRILEALLEMNGARVTELANQLDMSPSTVHSHLATLEDHEYLVKEGDIYRLSMRFVTISGHVRQRKVAYEEARNQVDMLAEETQERAQFLVEEHGKAYYVHTRTGEHAVQTNAQVGKRSYLHASAAGKAILAHLPEHRIDEILAKPLNELTANTITDPAALRENLAEIRERGISFNEEESVTGLHAVGVPVQSPSGFVLGALSVSGPSNRLSGTRFREEIPQLLQGTANELELNIAFS